MSEMKKRRKRGSRRGEGREQERKNS